MTIIQSFVNGSGNKLTSANLAATTTFRVCGGQVTGSQFSGVSRGTLNGVPSSINSGYFASDASGVVYPTDRTDTAFAISATSSATFSNFNLKDNNYNQALVSTTNPAVTFFTNGTVTRNWTSDQNWGSPTTASAGNGYWIKFHQESGDTLTDGPYDSWLQLTSDRTVTLIGSSGFLKQALVSYIISNASGGATIASGNIQLESDQS